MLVLAQVRRRRRKRYPMSESVPWKCTFTVAPSNEGLAEYISPSQTCIAYTGLPLANNFLDPFWIVVCVPVARSISCKTARDTKVVCSFYPNVVLVRFKRNSCFVLPECYYPGSHNTIFPAPVSSTSHIC